MTAKLVVLYPKPLDPENFENYYHSEHMPLMRRLVGPDIPLPTSLIRNTDDAEPQYYRMAEVVFPDKDALFEFIQSEGALEGRKSAEKVSTGGAPKFLLCFSD